MTFSKVWRKTATGPQLPAEHLETGVQGVRGKPEGQLGLRRAGFRRGETLVRGLQAELDSTGHVVTHANPLVS